MNFCDTNQRKCWTTFPDINSYFIKSAFTSPANKYEIVRKCENFYYQKANPIVSGDNCYWCTNKCKNIDSDTNLFFVSDNQKCINSCNEINKYYYDDNNECIDSCELRPTKPYSYPVIGNTPEKFRDSCNLNERGVFHNYNSHICLSSCDVNGNIFLYYKKTTDTDDSNKNICYPSCLDIPGGTYKYELKDKSCTNQEINLPYSDIDTHIYYDYYYEKNNGVIKYVEAIDCKNLNYMYIVGDECKRNYNNDYYKISVIITLSHDNAATSIFIKCFADPSDCLNARIEDSPIYYSNNLKKCWNEENDIPTNYFIKKISNDLYELIDNCENFIMKKIEITEMLLNIVYLNVIQMITLIIILNILFLVIKNV